MLAPVSNRWPARSNPPHRLPAASFFSKTVTRKPAFAGSAACANPPIPAPTTMADFVFIG